MQTKLYQTGLEMLGSQINTEYRMENQYTYNEIVKRIKQLQAKQYMGQYLYPDEMEEYKNLRQRMAQIEKLRGRYGL